MSYEPVGGTNDGPIATGEEVRRAQMAIRNMESATKFDKIHKGKTVVIMGNAEHMCDMDLSPLQRFPIIACNRILRPWKRGKPLTPTYIMMGDREPFCQERDSGRLGYFAKHVGHFLGSDSLFQPDVRLRGPYNNLMRRAQPPPRFPVHVYLIGTAGTRQPVYSNGVKFYPMELDSFKGRLESCQNVAGSLIQAASIMGAKRILSVGIDLKWRRLRKGSKKDSCHTFEGQHGQHSQVKSLKYTLECFRWAKKEFGKRKVQFFNLSPVQDSPFASVWGNCPISRVVKETKW